MIGSVLNDLETLLHQYFPLSKVQSQSSTLEAGAKCSQYRKLMNRERCGKILSYSKLCLNFYLNYFPLS